MAKNEKNFIGEMVGDILKDTDIMSQFNDAFDIQGQRILSNSILENQKNIIIFLNDLKGLMERMIKKIGA